MAVLGLQEPRFNTAPCPKGYSLAHAERCIKFAAGYGLVLDPWQQTDVRSWLRESKSGLWCASTWATSVPRQNGKNGGLEAVELYLMVALNLKILHTSHLLSSARKAFKRLMYFFGRKVNDPDAKFPELNALVVEIRKTNGQEAIELKGGGLIEVGARTGGAGRGSSFDVLVVDEAQEYEEDEQEALEPTTSASPSGDPVTIYMGTPPREVSERGAPFMAVRVSALSGKSKTIAWVEHSADGDLDSMTDAELAVFVADRNHWAEANPALGIRIKLRTIEAEFEKWSARSFARERLNMWPSISSSESAIPADKWVARALDEVPEDWPLAAVGIDMNPERTAITLAVAAWSPDGVHVELVDSTEADERFDEMLSEQIVAWLWKRCHRRIPVVLDAYTPARSLEPLLKKRKMMVRVLGAGELAQACGGFYDAVVKDKTLSHFDQPQLNASIGGAVKDPFGKSGAWKWNRKSFEIDLTPTMAATCAWFGATKFGRRRAAKSSGEVEVDVL